MICLIIIKTRDRLQRLLDQFKACSVLDYNLNISLNKDFEYSKMSSTKCLMNKKT